MIPERSSYGWIEPDLADEFPSLGLHWMVIAADKPGQLTARSPGGVRERLRMMSDRVTGAKAVNLRQEEVPAAYRIFFRQIGIDPDSQRTPPEEVAIDRLFHGGLRSRNLLADAITVAISETGVGVFAFDADKVSGDPGLRLSHDGETLGQGEGSRPLSRSQIMVADRERSLGVLFGDTDPEREVSKASSRALLLAIRVGAITELSVEEALWTVAEMISGEGA
ncbi:MAG: hypothetical protein QOG62_984 [Thermoleophilaceae bacterium]|jgi:DNA/RNA-binding domain of Phe-tRNA-synthetase-like protein|nr:hypothetical protein [Thermoleophilaceae bacterium]